MRTVPIERLKSKDEIYARLRAAGIEPDTRQDGWPLAFGTFPVSDASLSASLARISMDIKEHFISRGPDPSYTSSLRSVIFIPVLSELMPPTKQLVVSHRPSEMGVVIRADMNVHLWRRSRTGPRRVAYIRALTEGIEQVREAWLSPADRQALVSGFRSSLRE